MKNILYIILTVIVVGSSTLFLYYFFNKKVVDIIPTDKSSLIVISSPIKDSEITSPLSVSGRARGYWFSEGSFPITLLDNYGNVIAEGHATAQGKLIANDFVKFTGSLEFDNYIKGSKGIIIFKKDNSISIPIIFK